MVESIWKVKVSSGILDITCLNHRTGVKPVGHVEQNEMIYSFILPVCFYFKLECRFGMKQCRGLQLTTDVVTGRTVPLRKRRQYFCNDPPVRIWSQAPITSHFRPKPWSLSNQPARFLFLFFLKYAYRKLKQDRFCSARVNDRLCAEKMKKQNSEEQKDAAGEESVLTWVGVICIKKKKKTGESILKSD